MGISYNIRVFDNMVINKFRFNIIVVTLIFCSLIGIASADIDITTGQEANIEYLQASNVNLQFTESNFALNDVNKNILWDTTHGVYLSYSPSGYYANLVTLLNAKGYSVTTINNGILNNDLSQYDILVIGVTSAWKSQYTNNEVNAIVNFVQNGGGLLIMGDNTYCPNQNINPVAQAFGTITGVSPVDWYITNVASHPIFNGVSEFYMTAGGEVNSNTQSEEVAWDSNNKGTIVVYSGSGRVVITGDNNFADDRYRSKSNNQKFTENIFDWLALENGENQPPIADAGADQTVSSGDVVYFDGSNSFDPDGTIVSYSWDFGDGDVSDQIDPAHRFRGSPYGKIYTVTLTVKDNNENIGKDTLEITVKPLEIDLEVLYTQTFPPNEVSAKIKVPYNWVSSNKGYDEYVVNPIEYEYGGKFSGLMSITIVEDQFPAEIWAYDDAIKNPEGNTIIGRLYTTSDGWISKAHTPSYDTPEGTFHGITVKNENKIVLSVLGWAGTRIVGVVDGPPNWATFFEIITPNIIKNDGAYFNPNPGSKPEYMRSALLEIVHIASPGELRVYDSQNKITGLINGEIGEDIPFSFYDNNDKTVVIMNPSGNNVYEVKGKETGSYGLYVGHVNSIDFDTTIDFNAISIPITPGQIHQYTIDWDVLSQCENGVTIQIDINGDGIIEETITSDDILTIDEFILQTETSIEINPDTLNLKSNGEWITAYIEFPTGYNVGEIELSSINLVSESGDIISSIDLSDPATIGDYDNNVISDLMVKFSRLDVVNYFGVTDSTEGIGNDVMVKMSISGELNDGTQFEGSDSIRLIINGK